jgi:hypothetical protein
MRVALGVHVIPLLTTVVPLGDCLCWFRPSLLTRAQRSFKTATDNDPIKRIRCVT